MIVPIAAAIWGGITVLLIFGVIHYGIRVHKAESSRENSEYIAMDAAERCQKVEEEFAKIKEAHRDFLLRPIQAQLSDEQLNEVAKIIADRVLPYTSTLGIKN